MEKSALSCAGFSKRGTRDISRCRSIPLIRSPPGTPEHDSGEGKPVHPRPGMGCPFHTFSNVERSFPANLAGRSKQTDTRRAGEHGLRHFADRIPC